EDVYDNTDNKYHKKRTKSYHYRFKTRDDSERHNWSGSFSGRSNHRHRRGHGRQAKEEKVTEPAELRVNGEIRSFGASWVERVNRRLTGNTGRSKVLVRKTRSARTLGCNNGGMSWLGNWLNNPPPTEIATLIDRPGSA